MNNNLKELRKLNGFKTAKSFADEIGISERCYSSYERGERCMPFELAVNAANVLNCHLDDLFYEPRGREKWGDILIDAFSKLSSTNKQKAVQYIRELIKEEADEQERNRKRRKKH